MTELARGKYESEEDFEIPPQILENLSAEESILFKLRTESRPKYLKYLKYSMPILFFIFALEMIFFALIIRLNIIILAMLILSGVIGLIVYWLILKKNQFGKTEHKLFISNLKLFSLLKFSKIEQIESIDLSSIKIMTITNQKIQKDFSEKGDIEFISDMVKRYGEAVYNNMYRIKIRNVPNLAKNYQVIESILWHFGSVDKRLEEIKRNYGMKIPYEFRCTKEILNKVNRSKKIYKIVDGISIISFIIGIAMFFMEGRINLAIGSLLFSSGIALGLTNFIANRQKKKGLPRINYTLQLYRNKITLLHNYHSLDLDFNTNMFFDVIIIPIVLEKRKYTDFGTIVLKTADKSSKELKIGPLKDYLEILEIIYLTFLNWKAERNMLLSKSRTFDSGILTTERFSGTYKIPELKQEIRLGELREINLITYTLPEDIKFHFQKYINENEKIYLIFKPVDSRKKLILYILLSSLGSITLSYFIWLYFTNLHQFFLLFFFGVIGYAFGLIFTLFGLIGLSTELLERKTYHIFSDQKIIGKYGKKYFFTPYNNVSLILRKEKKHSDIITLELKTPIKESPYMDQNQIVIKNIPKEGNIYEKIKYLKENANIKD